MLFIFRIFLSLLLLSNAWFLSGLSVPEKNQALEKSFVEKYRKQIEPWGIFFSLVASIASLIRISIDFFPIASNKNNTNPVAIFIPRVLKQTT